MKEMIIGCILIGMFIGAVLAIIATVLYFDSHPTYKKYDIHWNQSDKDCYLCTNLGNTDLCGRCRNRNLFWGNPVYRSIVADRLRNEQEELR